MTRELGSLTQHLLWLIFWPWVYLPLGFSTQAQGAWRFHDLHGPAILVSNHRSYLDPFFLLGQMPFHSPLWPIRFLVSRRFYNNLLNPYGLVMRIGGSLPVGRVSDDETTLSDELKEAEEALRRGEVVAIFPEGKVTKQAKPTRGGRGTAYLAMKTGAPVIPFFIEGDEDLSFWPSLLGRRKVRLFSGEPFHLQGDYNNNQALLQATEAVIKRIGDLYEDAH